MPTYALTGLSDAKYIFAVTAFNESGLESGYSNPVQINFDPPSFMPPDMPDGLRTTIDISVSVNTGQ